MVCYSFNTSKKAIYPISKEITILALKKQKEIAKDKGISQKDISKKLNRIKKFLAEG